MIQKYKGKKDNNYDITSAKKNLKRRESRVDRNATRQAIREGRFEDIEGQEKVKRANPRDWI